MDKRKQIIELIKEDSWYNIPVENTVDKIFSILGVVGQSEQLSDEPEYCNKHKWNDCECTDVCRRGLSIT